MARPIEATPILRGEDAKRLLRDIKNAKYSKRKAKFLKEADETYEYYRLNETRLLFTKEYPEEAEVLSSVGMFSNLVQFQVWEAFALGRGHPHKTPFVTNTLMFERVKELVLKTIKGKERGHSGTWASDIANKLKQDMLVVLCAIDELEDEKKIAVE